jgi:hypothetical protein
MVLAILAAQTGALPIPVAFLLISKDALAVTAGCETKTCCTALCYVDKDGIHHCVHKHSDACASGSTTNESGLNTVLLTTLATAPDAGHLIPALHQIGWVFQRPELRTAFYPVKLPPPPK